MGYETEVFLIHGSELFGKWEPRSEYWYTKNGTRDNPQIDELPKGAKFCDGGCVVATLKLSKIGSSEECGPLPALFFRNREKQKKEKKYILLQWVPTEDDQDERPVVTDPYGDPYVVHDSKETLAALKETIRLEKEEYAGLPDASRNMWTNRRLEMFEAMLTLFVERFPDGAVITRGY